MNRLKYLSVVLFLALLAGVVVACNNNNDPDPEDEGRKAGTEMCGCVSSIAEPVYPNPPASFNPENPDYTDPETLAYFATVQAVLEAYFGELANCAGNVANKYQKYFVFNISNYTAEEGLFSAFDFQDEDFQKGFFEAAMVCAEAFAFE